MLLLPVMSICWGEVKFLDPAGVNHAKLPPSAQSTPTLEIGVLPSLERAF